MSKFFECEACGPSERYFNGLCAICSTEKEQRERDAYIEFISGRTYQNTHNGVYIHRTDKVRYSEALDMVDAGVLYLAAASAKEMAIFRVTDEYMQYLREKDNKNAL